MRQMSNKDNDKLLCWSRINSIVYYDTTRFTIIFVVFWCSVDLQMRQMKRFTLVLIVPNF